MAAEERCNAGTGVDLSQELNLETGVAATFPLCSYLVWCTRPLPPQLWIYRYILHHQRFLPCTGDPELHGKGPD